MSKAPFYTLHGLGSSSEDSGKGTSCSDIKTLKSINEESAIHVLKNKIDSLDSPLLSDQQAEGSVKGIAPVPDVDSSLSETLSNIKLHIPKLQTKARKDSDKENKVASDDSDLDDSPFSSLAALAKQHSSEQSSLKDKKLSFISSKREKNVETSNVAVISIFPSTSEKHKLDYLFTKDSVVTEDRLQNLNQASIEENLDKNSAGRNLEINLNLDSEMPLCCNSTIYEHSLSNFVTNNNPGQNQSLQMLAPSLSDIVDGYFNSEIPASKNNPTKVSQKVQLSSKLVDYDKFSSIDLCADASYSDCSDFLSGGCPGDEENNDLVIDLSCALKDPSRSSIFESGMKTSSQVELQTPELIKNASPHNVSYLLCNLDSKHLLKKKFKSSAKVCSEFGRILCRRMKPYPILKVSQKLDNNSGMMKSFQFDTLSPDEQILTVFKKH